MAASRERRRSCGLWPRVSEAMGPLSSLSSFAWLGVGAGLGLGLELRLGLGLRLGLRLGLG